MSSGYGVYAEANKRQGYGLDAEVPNGLKAGGELVPQQLDSKGVHDQNYGVNADANRLAGNQTPSRVAPQQFDRLADVLTAGHGVPPPPPPPPPPPGMTYAPPQAGPPQMRNLASTPVIDINKLPRYGVLAPPIERPERMAGKYVDYDRATQVFVKNRGAMREALESKTGYYENAPMRMWSQFALKQKQRYVPIPPDANRRVLPETQGYCLRVLKISDLPLHTTFDGRTFEFQLGVSLYDEAYGTFYGNTVYSMSDAYDRNRAAQRNAIDLDFSFDVYYHTAVSDPRCMAVVEIIMVERMLDGVVKGEYSLGWALLPLFRVAGEVETGRPLSVPLVSGTPRYLLFRNLYNEDLRPPKVIPNCSIMFQAEAYPAMDAYIPLLPQDFLVSYSDVVPGLRRFDTAGQLSITAKTVISTLAAPMLSPTYSIVLRRLQLALPAKLHELLLSLDPKRPQSFTPPPIAYGQEPSMIGLTYTLRVSVHNSRTFVGPSYELTNISHLDVPGWKVLQVPAPDAVFDYVMGDVLTAIVVELLATPPQVYQPDVLPPVQYSLGWSAFVPFSFISDDGAQSEVAVGVHRYPLVGESGLLLRDQPPLDWRSLLGDSMTKEIPDPLVEFQLFETGRTPIPPPLNRNFTIIERQREEEAAMGEQPLEQVLAPVQVPPEIAPPAGPLIVSDQYVQDVFSAQPQVAPPPLPLGPTVQEQVPPILMARHEALYGPSSDKDRDQLRDLADAMQKQLALLTRAVDELKDERKSLRSSVLALADGSRAQPQSQTVQPDVFKTTRQNLVRNTAPDDIQRLMDLPPTSDLGDNGAFSGGPPPSGSVPSRMMMQQLYDSGMLEGLPDDVQAMLRRRGMQKGPLSSPIDLSIEARDPRMASDVVFQFLAYRHHDTLNAPVNVQSLYFTFQFYHFAPTTSTISYLVQPNPGMQPAKDLTLDGGGGAMASDPTTVNATRLLVTNHPNRKGAGVTVKYVVDASNDPVPSGQTPDQAAFEGSMHFAQFLAAKSLNVDVWDGESLLQVGTATLNLQSLLRQGRDFAELLVEVPIIDQSGALPESALLLGQSTLPSNDATTPTILSKGSLVVRVINIGREPRNLNGQLSQRAFDAAKGGPGKKVRVRVKPAWAVKGPISRELANGEPNPLINLIAESYQGEQFLSDMSGGRMGMKPAGVMGSPPRLPFGTSNLNLQAAEAAQGKGQPESEEVKMHILEREHHKSTRLNVMKEALDDHPLIGGGLVPGREDQFRQVQKQLLADVTSVRTRNKEQVIKDSLRKNMVISKVIRPGYGEVVVYEHEFVNPYSQEMVFEVKVSEAREVSVLTRMDEYRALRAANARFFGNPSQPVSHLEQEVMSGNRIYLQAHERITLPFKLQSFEPPEGYGGPKGGVVQAPSDGSLADAKRTRAEEESPSGHTVTVELVSVSHEHPVMVLELRVVPRPLVIDRTFRFYQPEHSLMRQTVKMKNLPGTETTFAGGALRSLAVACSHPDIIVGAGSSGLTGGSEERDEVYIKYKCGGAPEVTHFYVLLYQDRLLARPVEIWQVFAHCLRKVDMRAVIGQTSQASVVVRGAHSTRRVACYSSHPDELQVNPGSFVLVSGALTELLLSFRPVTQGLRDIKVNLVDTETRELVYALIITAEAQGPLVTRTFEVELPAGTVAQKKIQYTNPYQTFRTFTLRSNQPWLVHFTPQRLQLPPGATRPLGLTFDGRAATTGILDVLIFVNDEEDKTEECFKVRCRIYR